METDSRPWGSYVVLDEGTGYKVKRIEVLSGKRLSYQKHAQRREHWVVVQGQGRVTLDGRDSLVHAGETVDVAIQQAHRIEIQAKICSSLLRCNAATTLAKTTSSVFRTITAEGCPRGRRNAAHG